MPSNHSEEPIDHNTNAETLHHMIQVAERTSDRNIVRRAAQARAELGRREQKQRMDELLLQISALQETADTLIRANQSLSEQQASDAQELANRQIRISAASAIAAWGAAIAAFLMFLTELGLL